MPAIDGLSSGLDTASIIKQLMQLERIPQSRLKTQQSAAQSAIGSLRTLNAKFASVFDTAAKLGARLPNAVVPNPAPPNPWQLTAASSSDATRTTATATAGAPAGSLSFNVKQLATAASYLGDKTYDGTTAAFSSTTTTTTNADGTTSTTTTTSTSLSLTKGSGPAVTINTGSGSLADTVAAINNAKVGVTAGTVQVSPGQYRIQLTSTTTGAESSIRLEDPSIDSSVDPTADDIALTTTTVAQDAILDMGGGITVQRSSNTMSDVLEGVTLTLTKADTQTAGVYDQQPLTISVKKDADGIAAKVQALVDAANAARGDAKSLTDADPVTKVKGRLYGESSVRGLVDRVRSVFSEDTTALSKAGITVDRFGVASLDKAKFLEALATDPAVVEKAVGQNGLAGRLHTLADNVSRSATGDGGPGLITNTITSKERQIDRLKDNIEGWDRRLEMKQKQLQRQYTALETALGKAQSQGQWLSGQLANLPQWSS